MATKQNIGKNKSLFVELSRMQKGVIRKMQIRRILICAGGNIFCGAVIRQGILPRQLQPQLIKRYKLWKMLYWDPFLPF
jgi:hypothetical protein